MSSFIETRIKVDTVTDKREDEKNCKIPLIKIGEYEEYITNYYKTNYMNFLPPRSLYGKKYLSHVLDKNEYPLFLYLTIEYDQLYNWLSYKKKFIVEINDKKNRVSHFELVPTINFKINVYIYTFRLCFLCF